MVFRNQEESGRALFLKDGGLSEWVSVCGGGQAEYKTACQAKERPAENAGPSGEKQWKIRSCVKK